MSATKVSKEQKQLAVSKAILEVIDRDGLTGVTHSKVARKAGVSRAWIYEYIGKEKPALIEYAAEVFAGHFVRAKIDDVPKSKEQLEPALKEGIEYLFDSVDLSPTVVKLYFRFRGTPTAIGSVIKKYEKYWVDRTVKLLADLFSLPKKEATLVAELTLTLRMGYAHRYATSSQPKTARENARQTFEYLNAIFLEKL